MSNSQSTSSSTIVSEPDAISYWDQKLKALDDRLRAYGHTVTVTAASDGEELTVSIPQGMKFSRMEGMERQINARFATPSTARNTTDLPPSPSRRRKSSSTFPQ